MSNAQPTVSVIIPVYNVERYLDKCVSSVVEQTYSNLEIILVNDGSTDSSGTKCDEWRKKDNRITVVHKQNEGLNYARRDGFAVASGEYVTFLDSDDFFDVDTIKTSLGVALEKNADVVVYTHIKFTDTQLDSDTLPSIEAVAEVTTLDTKHTIARYALFGEVASVRNTQYMIVCGKLYHRAVVESVDWEVSNYRAYEDNFWTPQALISANRIALLSQPLYYYRFNTTQGTERTLRDTLLGNSRSGVPVGYLELVEHQFVLYKKLAKKYQYKDIDALEDLKFAIMWWRLENLIKAGVLGEENNLEYFKDIWKRHLQQYTDLQLTRGAQAEEIERLKEELEAYSGIKRTARRLVGNVKRKIFTLTALPKKKKRAKVVALVPYKFDADFLDDLKENLSGLVDEFLIQFDEHGDLMKHEGKYRRAMVEKARSMRADWVVTLDPDERFEKAAIHILRGFVDKHLGQKVMFEFNFRELYTPDKYRVDGIWGKKHRIAVFPVREDNIFTDLKIHAPKNPLNEDYETVKTDLNIYHLKHIRPDLRKQRRDLYTKLDPKQQAQGVGYEYLVDEEGMVLEDIPEGREYLPAYREYKIDEKIFDI